MQCALHSVQCAVYSVQVGAGPLGVPLLHLRAALPGNNLPPPVMDGHQVDTNIRLIFQILVILIIFEILVIFFILLNLVILVILVIHVILVIFVIIVIFVMIDTAFTVMKEVPPRQERKKKKYCQVLIQKFLTFQYC